MSTATHQPGSLVHRRRLDQPFLRAKFRAPGTPRHLVRRHRLLALLDRLAEYPVTAIVAPAGTGKTVLAADWLEQRRRPTAWVTLDVLDRDPDQLWRSLLTAVGPVAAGTVSEASRRLPVDEQLSAVLAGLTRRGGHTGPMTLVIDDADRVDDDGRTGAVLTAFVEQKPDWLHLLILSRRRLSVPVERLQVGGALAEIHFDALRFSAPEAASLLTGLCPDLPVRGLRAAVERADGWAAALQLTALATRSRWLTSSPVADPSVAAPDKLVDEYLWKEVLGPAHPELVGVLLATAVVDRISYGLAEALTLRSDVGDLLERAEADGLFVTSLDREWFEVHSLVRDVLTHRLQLRRPEALRTQHARAAEWFESTGDDSAALDHWLSAERPHDALRVLSDLALPLLHAGEAGRILDALERIPAAAAVRGPDDAVRYAWCQLAAGPRGFADSLGGAEAAVDVGAEPAGSRMRTLHGVSHWLSGDWQHAAAEARGALDGCAAVVGDPVDRFGWHLVSSGIALDERWDEEADTVCEGRAARLKDPSTRESFDGVRALGLALAGRASAARRAVEDATHAAGTGRAGSPGVELALADAVVEREVDHRDPAEASLEELAARSTYPDPVLQLIAQLELARLHLSTGDLVAARTGLDDAERTRGRLAGASRDPAHAADASRHPAAAALVARLGVDLALATDDSATAARWTADVRDPFWGATCEAKVSLARGLRQEALDALLRASPRCPRHEVVRGLLMARALERQDRGAALERVGTTLELAAGHGMLRTVAAEGTSVMELIELACWRVPPDWMDALRRALVPTWLAQDARRPVEDLTERERDVLRLLPSRLTLGEIASELYVSPNTLKFHLRAIYRKLGVVSRAEAVDSARQMLLLPRG